MEWGHPFYKILFGIVAVIFSIRWLAQFEKIYRGFQKLCTYHETHTFSAISADVNSYPKLGHVHDFSCLVEMEKKPLQSHIPEFLP